MDRTLLVLMVCICGLFVMAASGHAATYTFGKNGNNQDLTASLAGSNWMSSDVFIIAGDCYVDVDDVLTISSGVNVYFGGHFNAFNCNS